MERQLGGPNSLHVFLLVHLFWHLAFTLALWKLISQWWSNKGALLCIWLWCVGAPASLNTYATPFGALNMWKDDPEMTVALCVLGAMMATRAFVLTSRKRWAFLALVAFAFSLSLKESGYVTPFFVAFTLWRFGATKPQWRLVPLFLVTAIVAFGYRTWALQGLGGYHGTNGSWWMRAVNELGGGTISASAWSGASMTVSVAALILGVSDWLRDRRKNSLFWIGLCVVAWAWSESNSSERGGSLLQLFDFEMKNPVYNVLPSFLLVFIVWQLFLTRRPRVMLWGYIWVLLAYIPLLKQAVTAHGFYFVSVGWALWLAGALASIYPQFRRVLQSEKVKTMLHATHSRRNPLVRRRKTSGTA
ncbi:MAG: hypothetical protein EOO38_22985 [Cytophagaceae bacterium]|nr:MAG: hypothetical protein EOO38_22985 [Cytophagaceae bacterium]